MGKRGKRYFSPEIKLEVIRRYEAGESPSRIGRAAIRTTKRSGLGNESSFNDPILTLANRGERTRDHGGQPAGKDGADGRLSNSSVHALKQ